MQDHYGWWLVAIGIVILTLTGDGLTSAFLAAWTSNDFWGAAPMTWLVSPILWGSRLLLPVIGLAVDRFGARAMMLGGLPFCAIVATSAVLQPSPTVAAALFAFLMVGTLVCTNAPVLKAINDWFDFLKPLAIAVLLFAVDLLRFPVALAGVGGRTSVLVFAVLIAAVALPLATQVRRPPQRIDLHTDGDRPSEGDSTRPGSPRATPEYGWVAAVRSREFWLLTVAAASLGAVDQLTRTMLFPIASYRYELEGSFGQFETPHQIVSALFVLIGGLMGTRMSLRSALLIFACVHVLAVLTVLISPTSSWLFFATAILGAAHGGARAPGIAAVGNYFGKYRFGALLGTLTLLAHLLGLAYTVGPSWIGDLSVNPTWALVTVVIPAAVGVGAYGLLSDPKPAPSAMARENDA